MDAFLLLLSRDPRVSQGHLRRERLHQQVREAQTYGRTRTVGQGQGGMEA